MSSRKLLSENRIASLFERAAEGNRPVDIVTSGGRARWLRTIDFTRPTKFTPDQESRLRRAHDTFARLASTKLAAGETYTCRVFFLIPKDAKPKTLVFGQPSGRHYAVDVTPTN